MNENEREQMEEINKELMIANADYEDLKKKLIAISLRIFRLKQRINNVLNGE